MWMERDGVRMRWFRGERVKRMKGGVRLSEGSFCRELMHVSCSNLAGAV